jgi:hypothetical protein
VKTLYFGKLTFGNLKHRYCNVNLDFPKVFTFGKTADCAAARTTPIPWITEARVATQVSKLRTVLAGERKSASRHRLRTDQDAQSTSQEALGAFDTVAVGRRNLSQLS